MFLSAHRHHDISDIFVILQVLVWLTTDWAIFTWHILYHYSVLCKLHSHFVFDHHFTLGTFMFINSSFCFSGKMNAWFHNSIKEKMYTYDRDKQNFNAQQSRKNVPSMGTTKIWESTMWVNHDERMKVEEKGGDKIGRLKGMYWTDELKKQDKSEYAYDLGFSFFSFHRAPAINVRHIQAQRKREDS